MKTAKLIICALLVAVGAGCAHSIKIQTLEPAISPEGKAISPIVIEQSERKFRIGEKLTYQVNFLGLSIGRITLWVKEAITINERHVYHFVLTARSNRVFTAFCWIDDTIHSYVDAEDFLPVRFERYFNHRGRRTQLVVDYDQKNLQASYSSGSEVWTNKLEGNVQDPLSVFYIFRTDQLEIGKTGTYAISTGKNTYAVDADVRAAGELTIRSLGKFPALQVEPRARENGEIITAGNAWGWFSADKRRIPLFIMVKCPIGTITARLEDIE